MKSEKTISVTKQIEFLQIFNGAGWILAGIFNLGDTALCKTLHAVSMLICIMSITYVLTKQKEEMDEMALENLYKAKAAAFDIMHCVFCVAMILSMLVLKKLTKMEIEWSSVLMTVFCFVIGFQNLIVGLTFRKLEAE